MANIILSPAQNLSDRVRGILVNKGIFFGGKYNAFAESPEGDLVVSVPESEFTGVMNDYPDMLELISPSVVKVVGRIGFSFGTYEFKARVKESADDKEAKAEREKAIELLASSEKREDLAARVKAAFDSGKLEGTFKGNWSEKSLAALIVDNGL